MLKRVIILLLLLLSFAFIYQYMKANTSPLEIVLTPTGIPLPTKEVSEHKVITFHNEQYAYAYFIVQQTSHLSLLPNFSERVDAETLKATHACTSVINGGFYDKENKPLGLFQTGDTIYGRRLDSALFNGFVWEDASGTAVISSEPAPEPVQFVLQTGPLLLFHELPLPLAIHNDQPARRMVAAKNSELLFITVYKEDAVFDGPLLGELPKIIEEISQKENLHISAAINLDGGSASAFYSADTRLSELTPVGSVFCIWFEASRSPI